MGAILQFAERLADGQDWTASERAQLRDVGAQLDGVDVVFGKSEAGDPWCVVTDDGGEVLLHVARIGGDFVVHATRDDEVVQDDDLWTAAKRLLGDVLKERRGVLLAFPPEALGQTAVLAFLFAAAMRGEFDHWVPNGHGDLPPPVEPDGGGIVEVPPAPEDPAREAAQARHAADDAPGRGGDIKEAARASVPDAEAPAARDDGPGPARGDDAPAQDRAPAPASAQAANLPTAPALPDPNSHRGGAAGGGQTEVTSFNAGGGSGGGAQTAGTGPTSEPQAPLSEFVEGGDGDDRIAMSGNVAAAGGRGADTFVLALPTTAAQGAPVLLGFVADFNSAEGDRLELSGNAVMVVDRTDGDLLSAVRTRPGSASGAGVAAGTGTVAVTDSVPIMSGRHIGYDLNGDGKEDAYVLVTGSGGTWFTSVRPATGGAAGGSVGSVNVGGVTMGGAPGMTGGFPGGDAHAPIGITAAPPAEGKDFLF